MPKKSKKGGLGRAIIRDRFSKAKNLVAVADSVIHTTDLDDGANYMRLQSVTQEGNLEEFLNTAELAGTEFLAERLNIKVVEESEKNPYLLSKEEEQNALKQFDDHHNFLTVPRRPKWDSSTTPEELDQMEKESFLEWRRELVWLEEEKGLLLTPFERNLQVWRQLWRVIERSDVVVQIVDARHPLFFQSTDLVSYVQEVDSRKKNLLLVNKADMLSEEQRLEWANYFQKNGVSFIFFSAKLASEQNEQDEELSNSADGSEEIHASESQQKDNTVNDEVYLPTKIYNALELSDLFEEIAPVKMTKNELNEQVITKATIGLVGYPNVGKSSTINALLGAKKVAVGATPGKTKHFQTLHLSSHIILCDCPGLVFPNFATTKADMVCNGVLPIDQLREYTGPAQLVAQRIPKEVLNLTYSINIYMKGQDEPEFNREIPTSMELLNAYAISRGYRTSGQGIPDQSRAARYILKDYVNGKLLFNHPPPTFNPDIKDLHERSRLFNEKTNQEILETLRQLKSGVFQHDKASSSDVLKKETSQHQDGKSSLMDAEFFKSQPFIKAKTMGKSATGDFHRATLLPEASQKSNKEAMQEKKNSKKHYKRTQKKKTAILMGDREAREFL